jgi:hypothetical protein
MLHTPTFDIVLGSLVGASRANIEEADFLLHGHNKVDGIGILPSGSDKDVNQARIREVGIGNRNHKLLGSYDRGFLGDAVPKNNRIGAEIGSVDRHREGNAIHRHTGRRQRCNRRDDNCATEHGAQRPFAIPSPTAGPHQDGKQNGNDTHTCLQEWTPYLKESLFPKSQNSLTRRMESHEVVWEFVKCEGGPVLPAVLVVVWARGVQLSSLCHGDAKGFLRGRFCPS